MEGAWETLKESLKAIPEAYIRGFKAECNAESLELGVEAFLLSYCIVRFVMKKPAKATKYSVPAFFVVPLVSWPICKVRAKKEELKNSLPPNEGLKLEVQ